MNKLLIGNCICWETEKTTMDEAVEEMIDALVKTGIPLDINICDYVELRDANYKVIDC